MCLDYQYFLVFFNVEVDKKVGILKFQPLKFGYSSLQKQGKSY